MSQRGACGPSTSQLGTCGTSTSQRETCRTGTFWRGQRASTFRCTMEHDIYGAYCEEDQRDVRPILDVLRNNRLDIYDPQDGLGNETLFKSWLDRGIHRSHITLIFLTKGFVTNNYCKFQADSAVMRNTETRGKHRIVLVMLQSCKVPKNLLHFNCVYAWRFREEPFKQHRRILKAITSPMDKFRRGNMIWRTMNTNYAKMEAMKYSELPCRKNSNNPGYPLLKYKQLLLNLNRVKYSLENCEIKCTSENCTFRCSGLRITDQFFEHVKLCRYQQVQCRYCGQFVLRKNLEKHEGKTCRHRHVPCPNESCAQKLTAKEMFRHDIICSYKEENCPNNKYGCTGVFARKHQSKHLEVCKYERLYCGKCNVLLFRVDDHICKIPQLDGHSRGIYSNKGSTAVHKCCFAGCSFTGYKGNVETHQVRCDLRIEPCSDCGMRLPVREHGWHKKQCDKMIECGLCHQYVASSSKLTHDRWICTGQNIRTVCEICHTCVSHSEIEKHSASCVFQPDLSPTIVGNKPLLDKVPDPCERHPTPGGASSVGCPKRSTAFTILDYRQESYPATHSLNDHSFEQTIIDTRLALPMLSPVSSLESYVNRHPSNKVTPSCRAKWHDLMAWIDRNQPDLKAVIAVSRNHTPYQGFHCRN